jgi:arginine deiminase
MASAVSAQPPGGLRREPHDVFAETLREHGVRVHFFGELLAETLDLPEGRAFVLDRLCTPEVLGPTLVRPLRELFDDLDGPRLAECLVGGVLRADLRPLRAQSLKWEMLRAGDFVLPPLPNHLFTRDNSCWVYGGVSINPMAKPARQLDTVMTMIDRTTFVLYPYIERHWRSWTITHNDTDAGLLTRGACRWTCTGAAC